VDDGEVSSCRRDGIEAFQDRATSRKHTRSVFAERCGNAAEAPRGKRHSIPAIVDCDACHRGSPAVVLGFSALQLTTRWRPTPSRCGRGKPLVALPEGRARPEPRHPELDIANAWSGIAGVRYADLFSSGFSVGLDGTGFSNGYTKRRVMPRPAGNWPFSTL
jgi:hypothetical protein